MLGDSNERGDGEYAENCLEPRPVDTNGYRSQWLDVSQDDYPDNSCKVQLEMFLRHVVAGEPFPYDLWEGAKGVQLAELGLRSWRERRWLDVPALEAGRAQSRELDHA